eukprot:gene17931-5650_t
MTGSSSPITLNRDSAPEVRQRFSAKGSQQRETLIHNVLGLIQKEAKTPQVKKDITTPKREASIKVEKDHLLKEGDSFYETTMKIESSYASVSSLREVKTDCDECSPNLEGRS